MDGWTDGPKVCWIDCLKGSMDDRVVGWTGMMNGCLDELDICMNADWMDAWVDGWTVGWMNVQII